MYAIRGGKILTLRENSPLENKYIIVQGDKILDISDLKPDNAVVIDASRLWILPSFIDSSTALGLAEEGAGFNYYDVDESTNPSLPYLRSIDAFYPKDQGIKDAIKGGISYFASSPGSSAVFSGFDGVFCSKGNTADEMVRKFPFSLRINMNYSSRSRWRSEGKFPSTKMGIMALIREKFENAKRYAQKREKEVDLELEAITRALKGEVAVRMVVNTKDEIERAVELKREYGINLIIEEAEDSFMLTKTLREEEIPVIVGPYFVAGRLYHQRHHYVKFAYRLYQDGVLFALTTGHPTIPVHYLYHQSVLFVKLGMPEIDALKLIALNPAKILNIDSEVGTIEKGKKANLVFLSDAPYTLYSDVVGHMIEGEMVWKNF
ncbi:MAG: amidohydrolase family protein [candidate division WOR-3 bacterium]